MIRKIFKNNYLIIFNFLLIFSSQYRLLAQETTFESEIDSLKYEYYIQLPSLKSKTLWELSTILSLDESYILNKQNFAYTDYAGLIKLRQLGITFEMATAPSRQKLIKSAQSPSAMQNWDAYPSYSVYLEMMSNFLVNYPNLFKIDTLGQSPGGRLILTGKLSDNVHTNENEPQFFYSATIHGDEVVGYVLMLRLIDYLLKNYETSAEIKSLLDTMEIYINPLSNPDGTYRTGNESVYGATRYNSFNVDLNRNYPDPEDGQNPDGKTTQTENKLMMAYMASKQFVMSANFHGGAEVVNYPWDTYYKRHADDEWFQFISRIYADTVHLYNANYMNDFENGIVNGYDWYTISGGRQDYANYFEHCKEVTMEISTEKMPDASELPAFWNYSYRALIAYIKQAQYGIRGTVTDQETGQVIESEILIMDYDVDNSQVKTNQNGFYIRPIVAGTYKIIAKAEKYFSDTLEVYLSDNYSIVEANFRLQKNANSIENELLHEITIYPNPAQNFIKIETNNQNIKRIIIRNLQGLKVADYQYKTIQNQYFEIRNLPAGIYYLEIETTKEIIWEKLIKY
jgi:hypothetical protein